MIIWLRILFINQWIGCLMMLNWISPWWMCVNFPVWWYNNELCSCLVSTRYLSIAESMEATDVLNPTLNYGIVVDCGSSGSRVFVYYWPPHNGNPHTLLDIRQMKDHNHKPVVKKIKPGEEGFFIICYLTQGFVNVIFSQAYILIWVTCLVLLHCIDASWTFAQWQITQIWRKIKMTKDWRRGWSVTANRCEAELTTAPPSIVYSI